MATEEQMIAHYTGLLSSRAALLDLLAVAKELRDDPLCSIAPGTFERLSAAIAKAESPNA